ncbi:M56 family metallopeptidase [Mycobacterium lacus]|uniref:Uncharacterized protein n=1 Tax=Mycobacterium lacus TaxID=169765 RepID=A0A1X1Y3A2_9MYCO|nr:M56 family metallopeptidase [Mycobacterium lacus]MCV7124687.1 M56 family metallopeptidase [Mycobacterium lacus]ORW05484.1 hypothetical protein AWC15_00210 [Mycobacterium lacus]BBX95507.1 hypothetical protein MLAC_08010 [Mycobacterium lacus]
MSVVMCLLLYSVAVAVLSPTVLQRLTGAGTAPRLGVVAWLAAMISVVASWLIAAGFLIAALTWHWEQPGRLAHACFAALCWLFDGGVGPVVQAGIAALAGVAVGALTMVGWRLGRSMWRARAQSRGHAEKARMIGRQIDGVGAVVIDAPERAAYCVAGRPDTIVVTSAALDALTDRHLQVVLAHERAHLTGHHQQVLAFARALAAAVPRVALFSKGAQEIARLLEMSADDAAARRYGSQTLLDALLALSLGAPTPQGVVAAAGVDVLDRAERLVAPFAARRLWTAGLLLTATTLLVAGGPLIHIALSTAGVMWCYPGAA